MVCFRSATSAAQGFLLLLQDSAGVKQLLLQLGEVLVPLRDSALGGLDGVVSLPGKALVLGGLGLFSERGRQR